MTRIRRLLAVSLVVTAVGAAPAAACTIDTCFDKYPEPVPTAVDLAIYLACRVVTDTGGGC